MEWRRVVLGDDDDEPESCIQNRTDQSLQNCCSYQDLGTFFLMLLLQRLLWVGKDACCCWTGASNYEKTRKELHGVQFLHIDLQGKE